MTTNPQEQPESDALEPADEPTSRTEADEVAVGDDERDPTLLGLEEIEVEDDGDDA